VDLVALMPAFVVAVLLISASPGPAMALIIRRAALHGLRAAVPTVLGLELGVYLWALLAAAGVAALVAASQTAFIVLRIVGAAFLLYLGVRAWQAAWRARARRGRGPIGEGMAEALPGALPGALPRHGWWKAFGEGVLVQLANPKAALFMMAFYPQFVPAGRPLLATTAFLAVLQVALETVFYLSLAAAVGRAGAWFRRRVVRKWLEAASGTVLVGLAVRMAAEQR
jgi:threonine/homoserine/homoserine lactone efflux protein